MQRVSVSYAVAEREKHLDQALGRARKTTFRGADGLFVARMVAFSSIRLPPVDDLAIE